MTNETTFHDRDGSTLSGQTLVVIGGSAGIGLETARRAGAMGAKVILTARNPEPLERAAREIDALSTAAFDATDFKLLEKFFDDLPMVDHVLVTGPGPYYAPLAEFDLEAAKRVIESHILLPFRSQRVHEVKFDRAELFFSWAARAAAARHRDWSLSRR
jgi:NAD(P)-dependent dehydrogenase (short-subunit alcohol dehydrogenase family)